MGPEMIPIISILSFFGTIITCFALGQRGRQRKREHEAEMLRLENEARSLDIEEQRLRLLADDRIRADYDRLPR